MDACDIDNQEFGGGRGGDGNIGRMRGFMGGDGDLRMVALYLELVPV